MNKNKGPGDKKNHSAGTTSELLRFLDASVLARSADDNSIFASVHFQNCELNLGTGSSTPTMDELWQNHAGLEETYTQPSSGSHVPSDHRWALGYTAERGSSHLVYTMTLGDLPIGALKQRVIHLESRGPLWPKPKSEKLKSSLWLLQHLLLLLPINTEMEKWTKTFLFFACKSWSGIQQWTVYSLEC